MPWEDDIVDAYDLDAREDTSLGSNKEWWESRGIFLRRGFFLATEVLELLGLTPRKTVSRFWGFHAL